MTPGPSADLAGVATPWTLDPARPEEGTLSLRLRGRWTMEGGLPTAAEVERVIVSVAPVRRLTFESGDLTGWDTGLLTLLRGVFAVAERAGIAVEPAGLPDGVRRLLRLAGAVPPRQPDAAAPRSSWLARLGTATLRTRGEVSAMLAFVGEAVRALGALLTFRARIPRAEFWLLVQEVGARALPITALVGVLIGVSLPLWAPSSSGIRRAALRG